MTKTIISIKSVLIVSLFFFSCHSNNDYCELRLVFFKRGEPVKESYAFTEEESVKMKKILEHYNVPYKVERKLFWIPCNYYDSGEEDIILTVSSNFLQKRGWSEKKVLCP